MIGTQMDGMDSVSRSRTLLISFLFFLFVFGACARPGVTDEDLERLHQQAFIQDLFDENNRLRAELGNLSEILTHQSFDLQWKDEELNRTLARIKELTSRDLPSPSERIPIESITISTEAVTIKVPGLLPGIVADTKSMDPLIDSDAKLLLAKPRDERDVHLGDIIGYECEGCDGSVILHRVVAVGRDAEGAFFILRGDNNPDPDPEPVRFHRIKTVVVGIIY